MCHFWLLLCSEYLAVAECCVPEARNPTVVDAFLHFTWLWLWGGTIPNVFVWKRAEPLGGTGLFGEHRGMESLGCSSDVCL